MPTALAPAAALLAEPPAARRVAAIDVVRGLAMVIMALDHTREYWCPTPAVRPEDVAHASALLFFTRWITHFCAPTFVLLAGTSVYLAQQRRPGRGATSRFLVARGLWLVALELVVLTFLLQRGYSLVLLQVIWVLGWGMVVLAGLIWLPRWLVATLALGVLAGHNLLPAAWPVTDGNLGLALLYHNPFLWPSQPPVLVTYVVLPWVAVLALGYTLGPWFTQPLPRRTRWLALAGGAALLFFIALRATNWYGDPNPWSPQPRGPLFSALSFVNVTKYPPSLLFLALTLGVALVLLAGAERPLGWLGRVLATYGRVPLFYYLLHFALISGGSYVWTWVAFGQPYNLAFASSAQDFPVAYHPSLWRAYAVWAAVVLLLYWPCRWYQGYKQRHRYWWLSYL
jgi:uncharacterized membrane protein